MGSIGFNGFIGLSVGDGIRLPATSNELPAINRFLFDVQSLFDLIYGNWIKVLGSVPTAVVPFIIQRGQRRPIARATGGDHLADEKGMVAWGQTPGYPAL